MDGTKKNAPGKKATFMVQVQFQQNATWQGTVCWAEERKAVRFRSALELIKLMDDALQDTDNNDPVTWKTDTNISQEDE